MSDLGDELLAERYLPVPQPHRCSDWVDPLAAHHCRVLLFELAQASDWGAEKRAKDAVRRAEARARRDRERVVRAQGVGNVVDDTGGDGKCVVAHP